MFTCFKMDLALITNNDLCAIKPDQTKANQKTSARIAMLEREREQFERH